MNKVFVCNVNGLVPTGQRVIGTSTLKMKLDTLMERLNLLASCFEVSNLDVNSSSNHIIVSFSFPLLAVEQSVDLLEQ